MEDVLEEMNQFENQFKEQSNNFVAVKAKLLSDMTRQ